MDFCEGEQGSHCPRCMRPHVFRGQGVDNAFVSFPNYWKHLFEETPLSFNHCLARRSFARNQRRTRQRRLLG
jgi:hypothetical protein